MYTKELEDKVRSWMARAQKLGLRVVPDGALYGDRVCLIGALAAVVEEEAQSDVHEPPGAPNPRTMVARALNLDHTEGVALECGFMYGPTGQSVAEAIRSNKQAIMALPTTPQWT